MDPYPRLTDDLAELEEGWDADEFRLVAAAEAESFWARRRNRLLVWVVETYFPAARTLFDAGCGTGIVLGALRSSLPRLRLTGGDPYRPALDVAQAHLPEVDLLQVDLRRLPFDAEFDVVTSLDVLEHVDDDCAALRELYRSVRPGGGLLLAVPQHHWLWSAADEWALHHRRYKRGELVDKVQAVGFEIVRTTSFVSLLVPAMAIARRAERDRRRYDPLAELRLPRPIQAALGSVLALELALIRRGIDFRVGGSLVLVGRRPA